jgi:ribosome biogenesis GTPase / thiamine phosphate phosphatase
MDEHDYFKSDSKEERRERKRRSLKDRSQQKLSNQKQIEMLKKISDEKTREKKDFLLGRVLTISKDSILVDCKGEILQCTLRGSLKKKVKTTKNIVTVGDLVHVEREDALYGTIALITERKSVLERGETLIHRQKQILAANVDQLFITCSIVAPPLKPALIDRYIIAAKKGNITPFILINKIDLLNSSLEEQKLLEEVIEIYAREGVHVITTTIYEEKGLETLKNALKDKVSLLSGQSGVGKTSLLNALTGTTRKVKATVERTKKGSHTTTQAELLPLPFGGFCVDTPGIKSFALFDISADDVVAYFSSIYSSIANHCHFPNCTHLAEPHCAIKEALSEHAFSKLRYENYKALMESLLKEHKRR